MPDVLLLFMIFASVAAVMSYTLAPSEEEAVVKLRAREVRLAAQAQDLVEEAELNRPFFERVLAPVLGSLHKAILRRTPQGTRDYMRVRLREAGDPIDLGSFMALRFYASAAVFIFLFGVVGPRLAGQGWGWPLILILSLGGAYAGSSMPGFWLGRVTGARKKEIGKVLPDVLDLMCVSVEAGLGLDGAIQKVVERQSNALSREFAYSLREMNLGRPREQAWRNLAERVNVSDLNVVVAAILQAEKLGSSITQVLRVQAGAMREKRRQRAEEKARQVPVKLVFPLVMFIFPSIFVVLLGPVVIQIIKTFTR